MFYMSLNTTLLACGKFRDNKQEGAGVLVILGSQGLTGCLFNQFLDEKMEYTEHCSVGTGL